ncbi:MAG: HAD hydrolase family protein [Candidatus Riflebacteria bacterium]|nr:HAD hydrolase family protein [Candidatus Riflebacteria bacterium]
MPMNERDFQNAAAHVRLLLFDCDGVFTDGRIIHGTDGFEAKSFHSHDGMGVELWHRAGFICGCLTGRSSEALAKRARELRFEELHQTVSDKRAVFEEIIVRRGFRADETAYIGDDVNDLSLLARVGIFFAPVDANAAVIRRAHRVLRRRGGHGAVREAIDLILSGKGLLDKVLMSFFSDGETA